MTSNNQRSGSVFVVTRLSLLCQVVMMSSAPAKSAGDARYASQDPFIQSINVVPYNLDSNLYWECVLSELNAIVL